MTFGAILMEISNGGLSEAQEHQCFFPPGGLGEAPQCCTGHIGKTNVCQWKAGRFCRDKKKTVPRFSKETFEWLRINLSKPPPSLKMPGLLALAQAPMAQLKVIPSMQKSAKKCIPERLWLNFFFCSLLYVQTVPPNISFQLLPWQIRSWHGRFHSGKVDQLTEATNFWASPSSSRAKSQPWAARGFL